MSSEQHIPGNTEPDAVIEHPDQNPEEHNTWISRHSRSLWGVGVVSAAVILGVTLRSLFRQKD